MYTDEDLYAAAKAGIFEERSVDEFRKFIAESSNTQAVDEENFRLISGFNDIFVAIASFLLLVSAGWLGYQAAPALGFFVAAGISWGLSFYFVIKRKLALPAILFLVSFVVSVIVGVVQLLKSFGMEEEYAVLIATACGALAAWLHWYKFKVPITVAAGVGSLAAFAISIILTQFPDAKEYINIIFAICGAATFLVAMYWDSQDIERKSRKSDVAFWLHLLAAPLIVHPIFSALGILDGDSNLFNIVIVILIYVILGVLSIAIDRRALMISSLIYVLYAFSALFKSYGMLSSSFAVAGVFIGTLLLLLSAFWHKAREVLLQYTPVAIKIYLPEVK